MKKRTITFAKKLVELDDLPIAQKHIDSTVFDRLLDTDQHPQPNSQRDLPLISTPRTPYENN